MKSMSSCLESLALTKGFLCSCHVLPVNYARNTKTNYLYMQIRQINEFGHLQVYVDLKLMRSNTFFIHGVFINSYVSDHFSKIWRPWIESPEDHQRKQRPRYAVSSLFNSISTAFKIIMVDVFCNAIALRPYSGKKNTFQ